MPPIREARWTNPSQPQTLQIAVFLLYFDVVWFVLNLLRTSASSEYEIDFSMNSFPWAHLYLLTVIGALLAGRAIASEAKWGYILGLVVAVAPFVLRALLFGSVEAAYQATTFINLMFEIALIALLLHPHSREYQRVWFK